MNDRSPLDDEALSSYLDGEASSDEIARIEADPDQLARVEELRAATALVATPVTPLGGDEVDRLVDAALAASSTSESVIDLRAQEQRRHRFRQRLVTAAAGVLVIAVAVPALLAINETSDSDTADTASEGLDAATADDAGDGARDEEEGDRTFDAAADDLSDADMGAAEMAPADAVEAAEEPADELADDEPASTDAADAFRAAKVLPQTLGDYANTAALTADLTGYWSARDRTPGEPIPPVGLDPDTIPCGVELADRLDWPEVPIDLEVIDVAGEGLTLAVARLDGGGVGAIAAPPDCEVTEIAQFPAD